MMLKNARERTAFHLCASAEVSDIVARGTTSLGNLDENEHFRFTFSWLIWLCTCKISWNCTKLD